MDGLTEGRIVHYVMPDGRSEGACRPAMVVRVWSKETGMVNLQVFTDSTNDGDKYRLGMYWATSIPYSAESKGHTWHWIEKA